MTAQRDIKGSMRVRVGSDLGEARDSNTRVDPVCDAYGRQLVVVQDAGEPGTDPEVAVIRVPHDIYEAELAEDPRDTFQLRQMGPRDDSYYAGDAPCIHLSTFGYNNMPVPAFLQFWDQPEQTLPATSDEPDVGTLILKAVMPLAGNLGTFSFDTQFVCHGSLRITWMLDRLQAMFPPADVVTPAPGLVILSSLTKRCVPFTP